MCLPRMLRRQADHTCSNCYLSRSAACWQCRSQSAVHRAFRVVLGTHVRLLVFCAIWQLAARPQGCNSAGSAAPAPASADDNAQCADAPPFPHGDFVAQSDSSAVYTRAAVFPPSSIFQSVGLIRYITVFGIPIVATGRISDPALSHVSSLFADFLDNDRDGKPDNEKVVESMRSYVVVLGFLTDSEESSDLWKNRAERSIAKAFKKQFECRFRFFELWRSDINPKWHTARRKYVDTFSESDSDMPRRKRCAQFRAEPFDWPLWYFPFTAAYYGFLDSLNEQASQALDAAIEKAKSLQKFQSQYPEDAELEKADFFAWTVLTRLGATECHCDSSDVGATWKICTLEELKSTVPQWVEILESLQGIPEHLHDRMYASPAVVGSGDEYHYDAA